MNKKFIVSALVLPLFAAACDKGPTDPNALSQVSVKFGMNTPSATASKSPALFSTSTAEGLVVDGTNGRLTITNVSFIVSEVELECEGEEDDSASTAPACAEFKAPPSFVKLPLGTGAVDAASTAIPSGTYTELEFEVENLEVDEDDSAEEQKQITDLLTAIRSTHSDFPGKASMVVEGTFLAAGAAEAAPFRAYFDAEIEVEMLLNPALTISDTGASRSLSVDVQPALWFKKADGTVMDLSQFDFAKTGLLIEFEMEMDEGFAGVEFDD